MKSLFFFALLALTLSLGAFDLVRDGKPAAAIAIGKSAADPERFAAGELKRIARTLTGVELPEQSDGPQIIIGTPATNPAVAEKQQELGLNQLGDSRDGFVLKQLDGKLYAAANTPAGAMYAVFELLGQLGCRWYWAGADGEFLPPAGKTFGGTVQDKISIPDFRYRRFLGRFSPEVGEFMAHNKINMADLPGAHGKRLGMVNSWGGHSFNWIFPEDCKTIDEYFKKYPDHFALNNGVRIINQHCYTNPAVRQAFSGWIDRFWQSHPEVEMLVLAPRDTPHYCQCETCAQTDASTLAHRFFADLIADAEQKHPGKRYRTLAYSFYKPLPQGDPAKNQIMEFCMYGRCYKHMFGAAGCTGNERELAAFDAWRAKGVPIGVYGYHYDALAGGDFFLPLAPVLADELKTLRERKIGYWSTELFQYKNNKGREAQQEFWYLNRFNIYVATRLQWDASLDSDQLLREFCERTFGDAAPEMAAYYRAMHRAWQGPGHLSYYFANPRSMVDGFITPELIAEADTLLAKAAAKSKSNPRAARSIAADTAAWQAWRDMAQDRDNWNKIGKGEMPQRLEALKRAEPGKVLYENDFAGEAKEFNQTCTRKSADDVNFLEVRPTQGENFIFGNHPRMFGRPCNWMNYQTSFRFRFPDGVKNPNVTLCVRAGGQRFNDHNFFYYYISINPTLITCSVRERNRKPEPPVTARLRDLKLPLLEPGKWYQADIRTVDTRVIVSIDGKEVLDAPVPLGGGHINLLCQKPVDLAALSVREIPTPSQADLWRVRVPLSAEAPKLDGSGSDPIWGKGYTTGAFTNRGADNRQERTEVTLLRTAQSLYLRFICYGDSARLRNNQTMRDDDQWKDDCVELSLDPANSRTDYFYLVVNPAGVQFDALASSVMNINKAWNGAWKSAGSIHPDRWIMELELPFSTFGTPKTGMEWLLGVNRSGENIRQSWTDGSYHSPNSFRTLEMTGEASR